MTGSNHDTGRIVLFQGTPEQTVAGTRRAEMYNLEFSAAASVDELQNCLISAHRSVLVLGAASPAGFAAVKKIRAQKSMKNLHVFALAPDAEIDSRLLKKANSLQVELLPASVPQVRRWQMLRLASDRAKLGKRHVVNNLRAHFRLPLHVKAKLVRDIETVDISQGGVGFLTERAFKRGDKGAIDIRSLLGDLPEEQRGLPFEVVSVKPVKHEFFRFLVGAKFVNLSPEASKLLEKALEFIEPT